MSDLSPPLDEVQRNRRLSLGISPIALPALEPLACSSQHHGVVESATSEAHDPFDALPNPLPSPTEIYPSLATHTSTPSREIAGITLDGFIDGVLPATDGPLPTPPVVKAGHNLRLPSFEDLGIAAPHPDRVAVFPTPSRFIVGSGPLSRPDDPLHTNSPQRPRAEIRPEDSRDLPHRPLANRQAIHHFVDTFTPPEDSGKVAWSSVANVRTAAMESPAKSDDHPSTTPTEQTQSSSSPSEETPSEPPTEPDPGGKPWLKKALETVCKCKPFPRESHSRLVWRFHRVSATSFLVTHISYPPRLRGEGHSLHETRGTFRRAHADRRCSSRLSEVGTPFPFLHAPGGARLSPHKADFASLFVKSFERALRTMSAPHGQEDSSEYPCCLWCFERCCYCD